MQTSEGLNILNSLDISGFWACTSSNRSSCSRGHFSEDKRRHLSLLVNVLRWFVIWFYLGCSLVIIYLGPSFQVQYSRFPGAVCVFFIVMNCPFCCRMSFIRYLWRLMERHDKCQDARSPSRPVQWDWSTHPAVPKIRHRGSTWDLFKSPRKKSQIIPFPRVKGAPLANKERRRSKIDNHFGLQKET